MAIPSGSGSEVLRNAAINAQNNNTARVDWGGTTGTGTVRTSGNSSGTTTVPANVIITVLNITCCQVSATHNIKASVDWQDSGTEILVFSHVGLAVDTVFVWNEKMVLREGDILKLYNSADQCDWTVNFIYQDWTQEKPRVE